MHSKIIDLMCLTVLVYDYNEIFKLESMKKVNEESNKETIQKILEKLRL